MSKKIAGLWGFNKEADNVKGMYVDTTATTSLWLYVERDGVQEWRLDSGVKPSAAKVRTSAKAYALAYDGVRVSDNEMRYVVEEIGEIPEAVLHDDYSHVPAQGDTRPSDYTLNEIDVKNGWKIARDHDGHVLLSRDVSFLSPADYEHPESFEEDVEPVEQSKPETADSETVETALHGHSISEFAQVFNEIYGMLYDNDVAPADYEAPMEAFDSNEFPRSVLVAFNRYREDFVSSDREAAAFILALNSRQMQTPKTIVEVDSVVEPMAVEVVESTPVKPVEPDPVTAEIPEIPPQTEPHEVVATSAAIIVRKVTIPGGKSVKELSDVFGGFKHKPRGFRDSKGRRVAYVAFDGTGGVIAYRDCYAQGVDTRLEQDIADYLSAHNLKLAA